MRLNSLVRIAAISFADAMAGFNPFVGNLLGESVRNFGICKMDYLTSVMSVYW
uniref:Uncharacterized protein n=1 Tax=Physcomitrium patens TaxID=3218 RepID=A0A2K1L947_PHYPA|nr:hypothetical protein PHYPA_000984 [Physcomitrium patens]